MRRCVSVGVALVAFAGLNIVTASPANAWYYWRAEGTVKCPTGMPVVGVWISAGTQSGWASYSRLASSGVGATQADYSRGFSRASTYKVTVGCGGSPAAWQTSNSSWQSSWPFPTMAPYWICNGKGSCFGFNI